MNIGKIVAALMVVTVATLGTTFARAADAAAEPPPESAAPADEWTFTLAPYLWAAGSTATSAFSDASLSRWT